MGRLELSGIKPPHIETVLGWEDRHCLDSAALLPAMRRWRADVVAGRNVRVSVAAVLHCPPYEVSHR
jgi:hypothetical protein